MDPQGVEHGADCVVMAGIGDHRLRKRSLIPTILEISGMRAIGQIVNVSRDGLGIRTELHTLPRPDDTIRVRFQVEEDHEITVRGYVRWSHPRVGGKQGSPAFGVQLQHPGNDYIGFFDELSFA